MQQTITVQREAFACWMITRDYVDGSHRGCFRTHDPAVADRARLRQQIEGTPERLRFRMRRNGRTLYTGCTSGRSTGRSCASRW